MIINHRFNSSSAPRAARRLAAGLVLAVLLALPALAADPGYPLTLTDATGYALTLPAKPKAIASLTLATDELLSELADRANIKAIEVYATDPGISNVADFAKSFPLKLSGEKEKIIEAQPDLVFVASWKEKEFVQALRDAKVPVFVFKTPDNFDELKAAITQIASLIGETAKGKALQAKIDRRLAAVAAATKSVAGKRPSILAWTFYGSTYAKGTSFDSLVEKAGLSNAATQAGLSGWPQLSKEQILALDPDIIAMPSWSYDGKTDPVRYRDEFLKDPVFAGLKAVKNGTVVIMQDRHLQATSQFMVDGVEDLARVAWPDLVK